MGWKADVLRGLIATSVVLVAGSGCCHCGCGTCCSDDTKVSSIKLDGWDINLVCRYERHYAGGGGRGSLPIWTNDCTGYWKIDTGRSADAGGGGHETRIVSFSKVSCGEADKICAHTKGVVKARHVADGVHIAGEVKDRGSIAMYLTPEDTVLTWTGPVHGNADAILDAMIPVDVAIEEMLNKRIPEAPELLEVLKTERIKKHAPTILDRMRKCTLEKQFVFPAIRHLRDDAFDIAYAHAFGDTKCEGQGFGEIDADDDLLRPRVERDLAQCSQGASDMRCTLLARFAGSSKCDKCVPSLLTMSQPTPDAKSTSDRRSAWCTAVYALARNGQPPAADVAVQALATAPELKVPAEFDLEGISSVGIPDSCSDDSYLHFLASMLVRADTPAMRKAVAAVIKNPKAATSSRKAAEVLSAAWRAQDKEREEKAADAQAGDARTD